MVDKIYELDYKSLDLKKLDKLFKNVLSNKSLTDLFDISIDIFNNEQLNNNDLNNKMDKYIFCFGTLNNLRYKCYEG